jgi:hypothetical protein
MLIKLNYFRPGIFVKYAFWTALALGSHLSMASSAFADDLYGTPATNIVAYLNKLVSAYPDWIADKTSMLLRTVDSIGSGSHMLHIRPLCQPSAQRVAR